MVYVPEGIPVYACFISNGEFLWVLFGEGVYTCHLLTLATFCVTITHNISPTGTLCVCVCVLGKFSNVNKYNTVYVCIKRGRGKQVESLAISVEHH